MYYFNRVFAQLFVYHAFAFMQRNKTIASDNSVVEVFQNFSHFLTRIEWSSARKSDAILPIASNVSDETAGFSKWRALFAFETADLSGILVPIGGDELGEKETLPQCWYNEI